MKRIYMLFISLAALSAISFAQDKQKRFFFKEFQPSTVYYKDGRTFTVDANYDMVGGSFVFIDNNDNNQLKMFGEQDKIGCLKTDTRTFYVTRFGPTEVIQTNPDFLIFYSPRIFEGKKDAGYGTTSSAGSIRTYGSIADFGNGGSSVHSLNANQEWVGTIDRVYKIRVGGKEKRFETQKQFMKLFPKQKDEILKYIAEKNINFNTGSQVLDLYNHIYQLINHN